MTPVRGDTTNEVSVVRELGAMGGLHVGVLRSAWLCVTFRFVSFRFRVNTQSLLRVD